MSISTIELRLARIQNVRVTRDTLTVALDDGRTLSVPVAWFPRLQKGTAAERKNWRPIAGGEGIHWPDLDEDISVENLLAGRSSSESQRSLQKWLDQHPRKPSRAVGGKR
jgi:hypothetical protein